MMVRAHVVLPEDLLKEVDQVAGKRGRSRFVEAAIREKLSREAVAAALREAAGSLDLAHYPEWQTPEEVSAWVRASRRADENRLVGKLRTRDP